MSWDAVQCEVLDALGYVRYRAVADAPAALPDDPLLHALLRAAGRGAEDPEAAALCRAWPLLRLRGDAAAKRALWPQLRALRARRPR